MGLFDLFSIQIPSVHYESEKTNSDLPFWVMLGLIIPPSLAFLYLMIMLIWERIRGIRNLHAHTNILIIVILILMLVENAESSVNSFHTAKSGSLFRFPKIGHRAPLWASRMARGTTGLVASTASMFGMSALAEYLLNSPPEEIQLGLTLAIFLGPPIFIGIGIYIFHLILAYRRQKALGLNTLEANDIKRLADYIEMNKKPSVSRIIKD